MTAAEAYARTPAEMSSWSSLWRPQTLSGRRCMPPRSASGRRRTPTVVSDRPARPGGGRHPAPRHRSGPGVGSGLGLHHLRRSTTARLGWAMVANALACLADPQVLKAVSPRTGRGVPPGHLHHGRRHLVPGQHPGGIHRRPGSSSGRRPRSPALSRMVVLNDPITPDQSIGNDNTDSPPEPF
jgi:hypothetical protein